MHYLCLVYKLSTSQAYQQKFELAMSAKQKVQKYQKYQRFLNQIWAYNTKKKMNYRK